MAMTEAPSVTEIKEALDEHPRLVADLREAMLIRDRPAPGHLLIDRGDGDHIYGIERYAAREQVKAQEIVARELGEGCNSRFFEMSKMSLMGPVGPQGPVVWSYENSRPDRPNFKPGDKVRGTGGGGWDGKRGTVRSAPEWNGYSLWHMGVQPDDMDDDEYPSYQTIWHCKTTELDL